ncbi:MAG: GNAT family N-acetyltransferase [Pseudomonadota bacterium]
MPFSSGFPSRPDDGDLVKLYRKEKERNRVGFGSLLLFSLNLRDQIRGAKENVPVEIQFISDGSSHAKENLMNGGNLNAEIFEGRLRKGDSCCTASFTGEIISYCWVATDAAYVGEIDMKIRLKSGELYLYDAFTKPEHRGNGLFPRILTAILRYGRENGYQRALIFTLSSNNSSITAIKKVGFEPFQSAYFLDIYGKTFCRFGRARNGESDIEEQFVRQMGI